MRVKTFQGRSIEEVLPQIREELGEDAVVLSQKPMVSGGIGGFFGKRMIEVVAADRMPSDQELIELDESIGREQPVLMSTTERHQTLDVLDDWDPASDDVLAMEYGGIFKRAAERTAEVHGDESSIALVAEAPQSEYLDVDHAPRSGNAATLSSAMSDGVGIDPQSLARLQQAARATMQAPAPLTLVEDEEEIAEANIQSMEESEFVPYEDGSTTLRAEVLEHDPGPIAADTSYVEYATTNPTVSPQHRDAIRGMQIDSSGLIAEQMGLNPQVATRVPSSISPQGRAIADAAQSLERLLCDAGVDAEVASIMVTRVLSHRRPFSANGDLRELTRETIAEQIRVSTGWTQKSGTHKMAVVGPSGAGKSSIVAKLAESYSRIVGLRVGIISINTNYDHHGNDMHGDAILRRPGLDVRIVTNPSQTIDAIESLTGADVIMFDTPSSAYLDPQSFSAVARCLDAAGVDDVYAVVPLATSIREAGSVIDHFAPLQVNRLVISKLDESRYAGQLLNLCFHFGLPITLLSDGPRVPEDIRAASAREIAELILPRSAEK